MHGETCTDKVNVSEQESYKIGMRTCSKTQKYWIAHNFFNFDRNIGLLHLVSKKNFSNWSYPVLTTIQNDEDSNSLVILSNGHIMHGETCTD